MALVAPTAAASRWTHDLLDLDESWGETAPSVERSPEPAPSPAAETAPPPATGPSAALPVLLVAPVSIESDRSWPPHVDTIPPWARKRKRVPVFVALATLALGAVCFIAQSETPTLDDSTPFTDALVPPNVAPASQTADVPHPALVSISIPAAPTSSSAKRGRTRAKDAPASPAIDPGVAHSSEPESATSRSPSNLSNDPPARAAVPTTAPASTATSSEPSPPDEFNAKAAAYALGGVEGTVLGCKREDDPSGSVVVIVTYATSGHVSSASVSTPPYAGTFTGSCIERAVRRASIPAFAGDPRTVSKSYRLR